MTIHDHMYKTEKLLLTLLIFSKQSIFARNMFERVYRQKNGIFVKSDHQTHLGKKYRKYEHLKCLINMSFLITAVDLFHDPGTLTEHCKKRNSSAKASTL